MNKKITIISLIYLTVSSALLADWFDTFKIIPPKYNSYIYSPIELPEPQEYEEPSVEVYNEAVGYNNQAIEENNSKNNDKACELFKKAVSLVPGNINFRKNYVSSLSNSNNIDEYIKQSLIVLGIEPDNTKIAYNIGIVYLNKLKEYEKAADYFYYVLKREPDNPMFSSALISTIEKAKKYDNTYFSLLKQYSKTINKPYYYYSLGLQYLDRENYTKALSVLEEAKKLDKEGYSYYAYNRTAFLGGLMNGLESSLKNTITKFPNNPNTESSKFLYKTLKDNEFYFNENIKLEVDGASTLSELNFKIRPIKDFYNHQKVQLISTELMSKGKTLKVTPSSDEDGKITINVPKTMWSKEIFLTLKYKISIKALFNCYYNDGKTLNIDKLKKDSKFSLDDSRLNKLLNYIDSYKLEDAEKIDSPDELFAFKASTIISKGLKYQINNEDHDVSWALDNTNTCDCTEYSRLLTAICLKKGIPARQVSGFLIEDKNINKETSVGHAWSEVYIAGKGWTPFDPTNQSSFQRAYSENLLNTQVFFEYPLEHEDTRVGINYSTSSSKLKIAIKNTYLITDW